MALRGTEREGWGGQVICSVVDPEQGSTKRYSCLVFVDIPEQLRLVLR